MSKTNIRFERQEAGVYRIFEGREYAGVIERHGLVWCWWVVCVRGVCRDGWDYYLYTAKRRAAAALQQERDGEAEATA